MNQSSNLRINHYQHLETIFQLTVEATKKAVRCDRVIVYDASKLPKSEAIVEILEPNYVSVLDTEASDPCLAEEYLEQYCYGQAVAIDDISAIDLAKKKLTDLKKLEIKSLLIAPIHVKNELSAFLVVHQCSTLRTWSSETISFLTQQANTAGYALSNIIKAQQPTDEAYLLSNHNPPVASAPGESTAKAIKNQLKENSLTMDRETNSNVNGNGNGNGNNKIQYSQPTKIQEVSPPGRRPSAQVDREDEVKSLANVIREIAHESEPNNILNTAVNELRHLLNCDRVVVYSLNLDNYGAIIAESVAAGWTKALGRTIDDPCFAVRYLEKYSQGRIRAWDDIYQEDLTSCYLEQLEALEVKAKVVTPIMRENELFGLLIAHQCSAPRHWQEQEINQITEIATQVGLMLEDTGIFNQTDSESSESEISAKSENKWNQHFTDAIQYIRASINKEDILKASVREVRRVLMCDRVVVYSLDQDFRYGSVIAESVAPGWTRALNTEIDDPCFEPTYRDKYLNGRVRAWSNIYESGMTRCYIEQLEKLEVKANLVTPIINEGKLFGLLVAHQCSDFRDWQQPEVRWTAQIATQVGFALDNAKLLVDAKQLQHQLENETKLTQYFTDAVRYIRESLQEEDILEISVEEVRRVLNCDRVVVYSMKQDDYGRIIAESVAAGWTRSLGRVINDPCFKVRYIDHYRSGRVRAWGNIYESGLTQCYIEQLEQLEVKANLAVPIISEGQLFGLLFAHQCSDFRQWQQPEIRWVTQVATQIGFALDNAELLAEAKHLKQQVKDESKWTEYFTDATQHIRESLKTEDILKTSVKEVRRIIECDRVVVYSMNSEDRGEIVAESVAPGWTRAKGRVIKDPCFEARYLDKYRNGRVRAWSN
ncbi:MAG: GAF domain-containing protein, partial [Cyanobacteria bacterium P01_A01_bin.83]